MTIKELFRKTETMNELLKVVEKKFKVMIDFNDGNCYEFPTFQTFQVFMKKTYFDWFTRALMGTEFEWNKPIVNVTVKYWFEREQEQKISITLCEHDCK